MLKNAVSGFLVFFPVVQREIFIRIDLDEKLNHSLLPKQPFCQRLPKSIDVCQSYGNLKQCRF